ncbi:MAG: hypothetical protein HUK14_03295 [Muribaculaceae bacterium]|nr:hypothetical protein [Muribaculaceae bacterium]
MKTSILPLDIVFADPQANLQQLDRAMARLPEDTDILVLPELFTSSFVHVPDDIACVLSFEEATLAALLTHSQQSGAALAGSYVASDMKGGIVNRAFFIQPDGAVAFYDKKHLFALSGEDVTFTAGTRMPPIVSFRGWNIMPLVCYDLRFPAWCRNIDLKYDLLIVSANWGGAREYAFRQLLSARAIENQAYTLGANRTGTDDYGTYNAGMSNIYDFKGLAVGTVQGDFVVADLDKPALERFRQKFPVWRNCDHYTFD